MALESTLDGLRSTRSASLGSGSEGCLSFPRAARHLEVSLLGCPGSVVHCIVHASPASWTFVSLARLWNSLVAVEAPPLAGCVDSLHAMHTGGVNGARK